MSTAGTAGLSSNNEERELVFCHGCSEEWYRDEHGLICPACSSDFTEIIEHDHDPRDDRGEMPGLEIPDEFDLEDDDQDHPHFFPPLFGAGGAARRTGTAYYHVEGPNFSFTRRSGPGVGPDMAEGADGHEIPANDMLADLVHTMLRNIVGDNNISRGDAGEQRQNGHPLGSGPPFDGHIFYGVGSRTGPRDAGAPQSANTEVPPLREYINSIFGPGNTDFGAIIESIFPGRVSGGGDYVFSQAELDRVISQLMEQHQGNAPPPAPKEAIDSLPRIKVTEDMVNAGDDCAVCKDDLELNDEITRLPCNHTYHFECVGKWLENHDTCPICRQPISTEEQRRQQHEQQQHQNQARNVQADDFESSPASTSSSTPNANQGPIPGPMPGSFHWTFTYPPRPNAGGASNAPNTTSSTPRSNNDNNSEDDNGAARGSGNGNSGGAFSGFSNFLRRTAGGSS